LKNLILICLLNIIIVPSAFAQREYSNWYFGDHSGVTFNTADNEPVSLSGNNSKQFEGCATISDKNGNLLLYSNGEYVFNKFGAILNLGNQLYGHQSSSQSAIIIAKPGSTNLYYVFTADAGEYTGDINRGINYSLVDIDINLGQGGFVEFNVPLVRPACEQLSAVYHANGEDLWVVARGWKNNNFYSYLVTKDGIVDTVITSIGFTRSNDYHTIGCLKFSPDSRIAVCPVYDEQFIELYRFDDKTGEFYNRLQIDILDHVTLYGSEFSSDGNVLYISSSKNTFGFYSIFQFNISDYNKSKIEQSSFRIAYNEGHAGTLQRGPNNKIYAAHLNIPFLHSIESPNTLGVNAKFVPRKISLLDSLSQLGLPQSIRTPNNYKTFSVCEGTDVILDPEDFLIDTARHQYSYKWSGPNNFFSLAPRPFLENVTVQDSGDYVLSVTYTIDGIDVTTEFVLNLKIGTHLIFAITGNDTICRGGLTTLISDTLNSQFTYIWSTGRRSPFLNATEPGLYKLYITTAYGCRDSAEFKLTVLNAPKAVIKGSKFLCKNQPVVLSSENIDGNYTYSWSTGDTTSSITVTEPGTYKLVISNQIQCKDSASVKVVKYPNLAVNIAGDTILCVPGAAILKSNIIPYDSTLTYDYLWSTGEKTSDISITKPGTYKLTVTIEQSCIFSDSITIKKSDSPVLKVNVPEINELCEGDLLEVNIINKDPKLVYYWSDGFKSFPRMIKEDGNYRVIAENSDGCLTQFDFIAVFLDKPEAEIRILDDVNICNADSIVLHAFPKGSSYTYRWLIDNSINDSLIVRKSGMYFLVVTHENACSDTVSINLELGKGLPVNIAGITNACQGDTIVLTANVIFSADENTLSYLWSNGETTKVIKVTGQGLYKVEVNHISGCFGFDSVNVKIFDIPELTLNYKEPQTLCKGVELSVFPDSINPSWNYFWSDGSSQIPRIIKESGIYKLYAINSGTCKDSAEIEINFIDAPVVRIIPDGDTKLCIYESVILKASEINDNYTYSWSQGSYEKEIEVQTPGMYYLNVENELGCKSVDSILIERVEQPNVKLSLSKPFICLGDSLTINAAGDFVSILWETGDTTSAITAKKAKYYVVYVFSDDGCYAVDSIEVSNYSKPVPVTADDVFFGVLCPGVSDTLSSVIKNLSDIDIRILSVSFLRNEEFKIVKDVTGNRISPNNSVELKVSFNPQNHGDFGDRIKIIYKHFCLDSIEISLSGFSSFASTISLDDATAQAGNRFCFPVYYNFHCIDTVNLKSGAFLRLSFDAEYFVPDSVSTGTIARNVIIGGTRFLDIVFDSLVFTEKSGVLTYVCGRSLLGNDTATLLNLEIFEWEIPLKVTLIDGSLKNEACAIDLRPVKHFKSTVLKIAPNPAAEFMNINVISEEKGIFALELVNSTGITVMKNEWSRTESDIVTRDFIISTENLPSGVYMLRLLSPWYVNSLRVIIVK